VSRGYSLLEAVIAFFILLCCFAVIIALFQSGLRYSVRTQNQQLAPMLAERQIEGMRAWSETANGSGFNWSNLAAIYNGESFQPADFGDFTVTTKVLSQTLYSTSSSVERALGTQARQLTNSADLVEVGVAWNDGVSHQIKLQSYLVAPASSFRSSNTIVVTTVSSGGNPLPQGSMMNLTATGYDHNGNAIPDLFFVWNVISVTGQGTLAQSRDGSSANLTNVVTFANGSTAQSPGNLYVQASAKYHGVTAAGNSSLVQLQ
jgi:Tfp pilus assembly protein PilV